MKSFFALLLYRFAIFFLLPLVILFLFFRSRKNPAYRQRIFERLGCLPKKFYSGGIIIHAASVGEVIAIKPLIEKILRAYPSLPITVTTFTPTGSDRVKAEFSTRVQHCYLPIDNYFSNALFLNKLKPCAMVFMETELWPSLIIQAKKRHSKLLLVNARLTTKSVKQYKTLHSLITPAIKCFDQILCQSQINYQRFIEIGANPEQTKVSGNLKYDISVSNSIKEKQLQLAQFLTNKKNIWLVASTHPGDEKLILKAFDTISIQVPDMLLVLVPRHPERFNDVYQQCIAANYKTIRRSDNHKLNTDDKIWLLDSLGELMSVFECADVVTMGGSFSEVGGHNPLEPALFKKPIITGPNMSNFSEVMQNLISEKAIIQISSNDNMAQDLAAEVIKLFNNTIERDLLGTNAYDVVLSNQGATNKSVQALQALISNQE